jgi:hypothetical protein
MHYYRHKKYVIDKSSTISEKDFDKALQNLSCDIKKALSKFYNKTKELPIVLSYMTYDNDVKINHEEITELKKSNIKSSDIINSENVVKGKTITYSLDFIKDLKYAYLFGLDWQNENKYIMMKIPKKSSKIVFDKIKNASKEEIKEILTKHNIEHKSFSKLQYYQ